MKVAFVLPWYGPDIPGGAETAARQTAERLAARGHTVEVLTTCLRDLYSDWSENSHPAGLSSHNGVTIRRFPVLPRDRAAFNQLNWQLMNGLRIPPEQEATFIEEMFRVPALYDYIREHQDEYVFLFTPYMFSSTYFGAQIAPARTALIPCLHDEPYVWLGLYRPVLQNAAALIFFSPAEAAFARRLLGDQAAQLRVVAGSGVTAPAAPDPDRFRAKYGLQHPFLLYAGRREPGKNIDLLLDYWGRYQADGNRPMELILIGSGQVDIPPRLRAHTRDLGFVSIQDKNDAYAAALALCQPSVHESFSIVMMESWLAGRPVLVHADCAVTSDHTRRANGGLYFRQYTEFAACLDYFQANPAAAAQLGAQGRAYVLANYQWETVLAQYERVIAALAEG
ncbi:MAG: glycosyltransferase family 4 protein [Ardenticatenales bacterium]|nr:glycosyltransferase family 4 protein [Ardenticatenales bacterium]